MGVQIICNDANHGLSYSRNRAIDACKSRYLVFLDDDVTVTPAVVAKIRIAFRLGTNIVGVRLRPGSVDVAGHWFITPGQLHYLGLHRDDRPCRTWGGCMGIDIQFGRAH